MVSRRQVEPLRDQARELQRSRGNRVRIGRIVNNSGPLVGRHDLLLRVVARDWLTHRATRKEVGGVSHHRPCVRPQPAVIPRDEVVQTKAHRDITRDVDLIGALRLARAAHVIACVGRLPWPHRSGEASRLRALLRGTQSVVAVTRHRFCNPGPLEDDRGEDPCVAVPESVTFVIVPREAGGGASERCVLPQAAQDRVEGDINRRSDRAVPTHLHATLPQRCPAGDVRRLQAARIHRRVVAEVSHCRLSSGGTGDTVLQRGPIDGEVALGRLLRAERDYARHRRGRSTNDG